MISFVYSPLAWYWRVAATDLRAMANWDNKKIGSVVEVTSSNVHVALDAEGGLTRKIGDKAYNVGQIGTYVLIPIGQSYVIGIVAEARKQ